MTNAIAGSANRQVFFLGVNTGFVCDGLPDARFIDFYARRASPRLHCAIIGNVVVPGGHGSNAVTPSLTSDAVWEEVATAIAAGGSNPGIQLATAWEGYVGSRKFVSAAPSEVIPEGRRLVSAMTRDDISHVLQAFDAATDLAIDHGFRHIQIHAAHGYLLSLLIDARINCDAGFVLDRLSSLGARLKREGLESSIRISLRNGDVAFDAEGMMAFQEEICQLPFDFIDLSSGYYNIDKRLIYPSRPIVLAQRIDDSVAVARSYPKRQFIVSGRALHYNWTELPENMHPGICRDLIANPDVLGDPANGCKNHGKCHYFSRGEPHLTCARWAPGTNSLGDRQ
jgi:hypothetical protein